MADITLLDPPLYVDAYNDAYGLSAIDTLSIGRPAFDTGAAADTLAPIATFSFTHTSTGADASLATAAISLAEEGISTDALIVVVTTFGIDGGVSTDTLSIAVATSRGDSGAGTDTRTTTAVISIAESGNGADNISLAITLQQSEAGSSADSPAVAVATSFIHTSTSSDACVVAAANSLTDTGTCIDSINRTITVQQLDTGLGAESRTITASIVFTETATASEDAVAEVDVPNFLQAGTVVDTLSTSPVPISLAEAGTGTDTRTIFAAFQLTSSQSGIDSFTGTYESAAITLYDVNNGDAYTDSYGAYEVGMSGAFASDELTTVPTIRLIDTGTGADSRTIVADAELRESGASSQALSIIVTTVRLIDQGVQADTKPSAVTLSLRENLTGSESDLDIPLDIDYTQSATGTDNFRGSITVFLYDADSYIDLYVDVFSATANDSMGTVPTAVLPQPASATDTLNVAIPQSPQSQSGSANDTLRISVPITYTQASIGINTMSVAVFATKSITDAGTATERLPIAADPEFTQGTQTSDIPRVTVSFPWADAGASTQNISIVRNGGLETGTANDRAQLTTTATLTDTDRYEDGYTTDIYGIPTVDSLHVQVPVSRSDSGSTSDTLVTQLSSSVSFTDTSTSTQALQNTAAVSYLQTSIAADVIQTASVTTLMQTAFASESMSIARSNVTEQGTAADGLRLTTAITFSEAQDAYIDTYANDLYGTAVAESRQTQAITPSSPDSGTGTESLFVTPAGLFPPDSALSNDNVRIIATAQLTDEGDFYLDGYGDDYALGQPGSHASDSLTIARHLVDAGAGSDTRSITAVARLLSVSTGADVINVVRPANILTESLTANDLVVGAITIPLDDDDWYNDSYNDVYPIAVGADSLQVAIAASKTIVDSGAALQQLTATVVVELIENGTSSDALQPLAALALISTGSGTDTAVTNVVARLIDTGVTIDAQAIAAAVSLPQPASASEQLSNVAAFSIADSGAGVDTQQVASPRPAVNDTGAAAESMIITVIARPMQVAIATDTPRASVTLTLSEVSDLYGDAYTSEIYGAPATTSAQVAAIPPLADTGSSAAAIRITAAVPLRERSGAYEDVFEETYAVPAGTNVSVAVATSMTDHGACVDSVPTTRVIPMSESGSSTQVLQPAITLTMADAGTSADMLNLAAAVTQSDVGADSDQVRVIASTPLTQDSAGADALSTAISVSTVSTDNGTASDTARVDVAAVLLDVGSGIDSVPSVIPKMATDDGTASDTIAINVLRILEESSPAAPIYQEEYENTYGTHANDDLTTIATGSLTDLAEAADALAGAALVVLAEQGACVDSMVIDTGFFNTLRIRTRGREPVRTPIGRRPSTLIGGRERGRV